MGVLHANIVGLVKRSCGLFGVAGSLLFVIKHVFLNKSQFG